MKILICLAAIIVCVACGGSTDGGGGNLGTDILDYFGSSCDYVMESTKAIMRDTQEVFKGAAGSVAAAFSNQKVPYKETVNALTKSDD